MRFICFGSALLFVIPLLTGLGCERLAKEPVSFRDVTLDQPSIPAFYAWKNENPEKVNSFDSFLVDKKANWNTVSSSKENPRKPFAEIGKRLFNPETSTGGGALNESLEMASPNGQWVVKTYSIKTFADDLDNSFLIIRQAGNNNSKKLKVRAQSNGEMRPLFWHPRKPLFYFTLTVGEGIRHSYELWEYNAADDTFQNIGDTNGDIYLSPEGDWLLWETGLFLEPGRIKPPLHSGLICIYNIDKKINYQLVFGPFLSAFQRWKNP